MRMMEQNHSQNDPWRYEMKLKKLLALALALLMAMCAAAAAEKTEIV